MKTLVSAISTATLLLSSSMVIAKDTSETQVSSQEFQFEQAFQSPNRLPIIDKPTSSNALNESVATQNWAAKNQQLSTMPKRQLEREQREMLSSNDFWIYDSWATLSNDFDYDGYYSKVTVEFDADTVYSRAYVYGIVYLGIDGVFDSIHVTSVFAIDGDSSLDSFVVESELVSGFPSNDYEILIELYDADTDQLVAFTDGLDDADLAIAPLESENYEVINEPRVVVVEEHGGSLGWWALLMLPVLGIRTLLKRETHPVVS